MPEQMGFTATCLDYSKAPEDEFNDWYDLEQLPQRLAIKGFINAQRWLSVDNSKISLVMYDLDSIDVLQTASYLEVSGSNTSPWSRRMVAMCAQVAHFDAEQMPPGRQIAPDNAGGMLLIAMNVQPEAEDEFNAWNDTEHIPRLKAVPGVLCARRFKTLASSRKYIAIYHLSSPEVQASKAWEKASKTPWQQKMKPMTSDRLRLVLKCYQRNG